MNQMIPVCFSTVVLMKPPFVISSLDSRLPFVFGAINGAQKDSECNRWFLSTYAFP